MENITNFFEVKPRGAKGVPYKLPVLFEGIIPRNGVGVLVGEFGSAKSLFLLWLSSCLATGSPAFRPLGKKYNSGEEIPEKFSIPEQIGATFYFSGEGQDGIEGRIIAAEHYANQEALAQFPNGQLPIVHIGRTIQRLQGTKQLEQLYDYLSLEIIHYISLGVPPKLIVFDTMATCFEVQNEDESDERDKLFDALNMISRKFDCFIFVVMYPPKSKSRKGIPKGTIETANRADLILDISKVKNSSIFFDMVVTKAKDLPSLGMKFRFQREIHEGFAALVSYGNEKTDPTIDSAEKQKEKVPTEAQKYVLSSLKTFTRNNKTWARKKHLLEDYICSATQIHMVTEPTKDSNDTLRKQFERIINELIRTGLVVEGGKPRHKLYMLSELSNSLASTSTNARELPDPKEIFSEVRVSPPPVNFSNENFKKEDPFANSYKP